MKSALWSITASHFRQSECFARCCLEHAIYCGRDMLFDFDESFFQEGMDFSGALSSSTGIRSCRRSIRLPRLLR